MKEKIGRMGRICLAAVFFLLFGPVAAIAASSPAVSASPQGERTLQGSVLDAVTGEPVIGAAVQVQGRTGGEITNIDGRFTIRVLDNSVLVVTSMGYQTLTQNIGTQASIVIRITPDTQALEEVVVTAFGSSQRKESVTGAIQVVNPSDLKVPTANLSNSFAGRLSGVISYQRSGEPGSNGSNFYIRGISTLSGITSPLIVMDGVEISAADLNAVDPEIIASFSILKDATATAMYGTRGANGVMIIKTKSGSDLERPVIGVRVESYVNTPTKIPQFVDGPSYMKMYNEAVTNQGTGAVLFTKEQMQGARDGINPYIFPNVNWYDEIFKDYTLNQKANFNIRGGTSKITYFMNMSFNHETGMLKNNSQKYYSYKNNIDLMKYAFQNNVDFHFSRTSTISLHLNVQLNNYKGPSSSVADIFGSIMDNNPVDFPISFPDSNDGEWVHWGILSGGNTQGASNPMALATRGYKDYFENTVIANLDFTQNLDFITEGLSFKALASFKNWNRTSRDRHQSVLNRYYISSWSVDPTDGYSYSLTPLSEPTNSTLVTSTGNQGDRTTYFQTYLNYDRNFGEHYVNGMLLFNTHSYNVNNPGGENSNAILINSLPKRKMGVAARLSYDYAHKYLLELNAGYNGSENFAPKHRWGFFPSVSVGWNVSNEAFWIPFRDAVSNLKLRASYGLVGNDQIGGARFIYLAQVALDGSASYKTGYGTHTQSYSGPTYDRYQNDGITWEVGRKLNLGIDVQLFHALNITAEVFRENRSNIFQQKQSIPNYFGTAGSKIYGNLAEVENKGFETSVDFVKQFNRDWFVSFKGTFTYVRNKITRYDEEAGVRPALSNIGKKVNSIYGYVADGLYIDDADIRNSATSTIGNIAIAPGDIKYLDQPDAHGEYDGRITSDDRIVLGWPTVPEIIFGFGPSIAWKKLDFSFFFQGAAHVSLMMSGFSPFGTSYNRNVLGWIADDYWSKENQNPDAGYPRLTQFQNNHNNAFSSFWLRSAAFLKLKNVELGYTIDRARIYVGGLNLLTFSPFKLWDPEMGGGKGLTYPTQRTVHVGVQMTF